MLSQSTTVTQPTASWPWLGRVLRAWFVTMLALFLGLLSLALVAEIVNDCRDEPRYLLTEDGSPLMLEDGSGYLLLEGPQDRACPLRFRWS